MNGWHSLLAIVGLTVITIVARGFFVIPERELPIPAWLREALRYAPLAALVAVLVPEIAMTDDHLIATWRDARLYATIAGALTFWRWRNCSRRYWWARRCSWRCASPSAGEARAAPLLKLFS
jgi:branched-subunit amino acid transport protein